ncbi:MAG: MerR family DNA-binding transcriptional regulator [Acidimicrobiales bacterium]|nr:MerR family DNA-binding transcriptional regulator [Acidimicrobiales bacterium]
MADRSHLSIGEVLSLLQDDFPDVTISKIRFLESQGLLDPERTPSGYRKFYEDDIERLRWILRHQRDHFLPLKVIKDRLQESIAQGLVVPPDEPPPAEGAGGGADRTLFEDAAAAAEPPDEDGGPPPKHAAPPAPALPTGTPAAAPSGNVAPASPSPAAEKPTRSRRPAPTIPPLPAPEEAVNPLDGGPTGVSLSLEELAAASGLDVRALEELARFGLIAGRKMGGDTFYDGDSLVVARSAAGFGRFGIEARHLRMYKVAAEREAGFIEQVVMPLLKQRNPSARRQAAENLGEMARLGETLRSALLRSALRDHTEPR